MHDIIIIILYNCKQIYISLYQKKTYSRKSWRILAFILRLHAEFSSVEGGGVLLTPRKIVPQRTPDARHMRIRFNAPFIPRKPLHSRKLIECERPRSTIH